MTARDMALAYVAESVPWMDLKDGRLLQPVESRP
jgi:hypothetical protein